MPLPPPAFDPFAAVGGMPSVGTPPPETVSLRPEPHTPVPLPGSTLPDLDDGLGFPPPPPPPPDLGFEYGAIEPGPGPVADDGFPLSGGPDLSGLDLGGIDFSTAAEPQQPAAPSSGPPLFDDPFDPGDFDLPPPPEEEDDLEFDPAAPVVPPTLAPRPFPDAASASDAIQATFQVRRRTGEHLGTFPLDSIRRMIATGELDGDDLELSRDGTRWLAPAQTPGFGPPVVPTATPPRPTPSRGIPPPPPPTLTTAKVPAAAATQPLAKTKGSAPFAARLEQVRERLGTLGPRQWAVAAGAAFVLTGGVLEVATPWGFWFHKAVLGGEGKATGAPAAEAARPPTQEKPTGVDREALALAIQKAEEALAQRQGALAVTALEPLLTEGRGGGDQVARAWTLLGRARAMAGKREEAEKAFATAADLPGAGKEALLPFASFLLHSGRGEEAASRLEKLLEKSKGDLDVAVALGQAQIAAGRMLQVDQLLASLKEGHKGSAGLLYLEGLVADSTGKADHAVALFEKALEVSPEEGTLGHSIRLGLADALSRRDDRQGAEASIRQVLEADPGHPVALTALAKLQLRGGDREAARRTFEKAIASEAGFLPAHLGRAEVLVKAGELGGARLALEAALALDGRQVETWIQYGSVLHSLGEHEGALEAVEKAKGLEPKNPKVLSRLGAIQFGAGRADEAVATLEAALAIDGTLAEPWLVLSKIRLEKGDSSAAIQAARRAVSLDPASTAASFQLGLAYQRANNPADALQAFQNTLEKAPGHADALEHQGEVYMALNGLEAAVESFEGALNADPSRTRLLLTIADCQLRSNRWDQAIRTLKRAAKDKGLEGVNFRLGLAHQEKGRTLEAIPFFQAAADEDPSDPRPWRQLGYAYKERNRIGDAVAAFRRYLERSPSANDKAEIEDEIATLRL